jgi:hypothetical protein
MLNIFFIMAIISWMKTNLLQYNFTLNPVIFNYLKRVYLRNRYR